MSKFLLSLVVALQLLALVHGAPVEAKEKSDTDLDLEAIQKEVEGAIPGEDGAKISNVHISEKDGNKMHVEMDLEMVEVTTTANEDSTWGDEVNINETIDPDLPVPCGPTKKPTTPAA